MKERVVEGLQDVEWAAASGDPYPPGHQTISIAEPPVRPNHGWLTCPTRKMSLFPLFPPFPTALSVSEMEQATRTSDGDETTSTSTKVASIVPSVADSLRNNVCERVARTSRV